MVISHDDTNDVLQNTFLKAWSNVESFRGDSKLSSWLYKIAINESITFINREKQRQNISIDDDESFIINSLESDDWFDGDDNTGGGGGGENGYKEGWPPGAGGSGIIIVGWGDQEW